MIPIQSILIGALLLALYLYLTRLRSTLLDRVLVLGAGGVVLVLVLAPELSTRVANLLGVGRGVDLVFYLSHAGAALILILMYAKIRRQGAAITTLTRALALLEAREPGEEEVAGGQGRSGGPRAESGVRAGEPRADDP